MRIKTLFAFCSLSLFFFISCKESPKPIIKETSVNEVINADLAFSNMSKQQGMKAAFIDYIDNEGTLLRPDQLPIKGAESIDFLSQVNDTSSTLSWVPEGAQISKSGELGFTYGMYTLKSQDTILKGTYVNIWKKQADGKWKFLLNSTNAGIKPGDDKQHIYILK